MAGEDFPEHLFGSQTNPSSTLIPSIQPNVRQPLLDHTMGNIYSYTQGLRMNLGFEKECG